MRLDNIVFRLGFADSRAQARQIVGHSMLLVNGKTLNIPSAKLKVGDEVTVKQTKLEKTYMKELKTILQKKQENPSWVSFDPKTMTGKILANPTKEEIGAGLDLHLVIEFYSR